MYNGKKLICSRTCWNQRMLILQKGRATVDWTGWTEWQNGVIKLRGGAENGSHLGYWNGLRRPCTQLIKSITRRYFRAGLWSRNSVFGLRVQLSSRHLIFLDPAPTSKDFGSVYKTIWSIKNHCIICTIGLLHKLCLLNRNSKLRLRLQSPKSAWVPSRATKPSGMKMYITEK